MIETHKKDLLILVILLGTGLFFLIFYAFNLKTGNRVEVKVDGTLVATFSLSENRVYEIDSENGTNELVIEDGEVYVSDASCPDGLCMKMGKIKNAGESIICLPNKVVITVVSDEAAEFDGVAK